VNWANAVYPKIPQEPDLKIVISAMKKLDHALPIFFVYRLSDFWSDCMTLAQIVAQYCSRRGNHGIAYAIYAKIYQKAIQDLMTLQSNPDPLICIRSEIRNITGGINLDPSRPMPITVQMYINLFKHIKSFELPIPSCSSASRTEVVDHWRRCEWCKTYLHDLSQRGNLAATWI
jgi:hypothetical protein